MLFAKAQSKLRRHILLLLESNKLKHWRLLHRFTFLSRRWVQSFVLPFIQVSNGSHLLPLFHNHRCVALFAYPSSPPSSCWRCSIESHTSDSSTNCHLLEAILQWDFCFIPELRSSSFSVLQIRASVVSCWTLRCYLPLRFYATAFIFTWQPRCALNTRLQFQCPHADTWLPCGLEF